MRKSNFLTWLHQLTRAGYDRGYILIQMSDNAIIYLLYAYEIKPDDAIDFLIRRHPSRVMARQLSLFNIKQKRHDNRTTQTR